MHCSLLKVSRLYLLKIVSRLYLLKVRKLYPLKVSRLYLLKIETYLNKQTTYLVWVLNHLSY